MLLCKQQKRLLLVIALWLSLAMIVCTSCRTRKVDLDVQKSSDKSKTEESSKVQEETKTKTEDKSKTTVTESDSSKTTIDEQEEITADEVIKGKDGTTIFKGNVKYKGKKNTNTQAGKDKVTESLKDVSTDVSHSKDSTGKKKQELDTKDFSKVKKAETTGVSWGVIAVPALLVLLLAFVAVKWNWLTGLWFRLFR